MNVPSIDAIHYATNQPMRLTLEDGGIRQISSLPIASPDLPFVAPGLIDLQINGHAGHDLNASPLHGQTLSDLTRSLYPQGVTTFFPTIITNADDAIANNLRAVAAACDREPAVRAAVAGIHLEGPFISPEDGPRGAHSRDHVRPPDWDAFQRWQDASGNRIRILTLSPEWPASPDFIHRCTASGVTVSIGHTAATPDQIRAAVHAGARLSTHLGNGAHLSLPRHPNYIWEQLAQDELWTCVIADGFHLPDQVLKVILKVKGDHTLLVSDAVALAGLPPGPYTTPVGGRVVLTPQGKLHLAENPNLLAGSAQLLPHAINHLTSRGLASFSQAWEMASTRPATLLGLPQSSSLTEHAPADLVLFHRHDNGSIEIQQTYKSGQLVYERPSAS